MSVRQVAMAGCPRGQAEPQRGAGWRRFRGEGRGLGWLKGLPLATYPPGWAAMWLSDGKTRPWTCQRLWGLGTDLLWPMGPVAGRQPRPHTPAVGLLSWAQGVFGHHQGKEPCSHHGRRTARARECGSPGPSAQMTTKSSHTDPDEDCPPARGLWESDVCSGTETRVCSRGFLSPAQMSGSFKENRGHICV